MAYTITQARKLLTTGELSVFESSRPQPMRGLTPARLRSKLERSRKLRDKYRDLFRRQTVATRAAPARKRSPVGSDNQRTRQKAELFAEVLTRYETELKRVDAAAKAAAKAAEKAAKAAAKAAAASARKGATSARKAGASTRAGKTTTARKSPGSRKSPTATKRASATGQSTASKVAKTPRVAKGATSATSIKGAKAAKAATSAGAGAGAGADRATSGATAKPRRKISLKTAVAEALEKKNAAEARKSAATRKRSSKAPASKTGTVVAEATAPVDVTPETKRLNPLRKDSGNQAIHAHQRSQQRRVQARRDSR